MNKIKEMNENKKERENKTNDFEPILREFKDLQDKITDLAEMLENNPESVSRINVIKDYLNFSFEILISKIESLSKYKRIKRLIEDDCSNDECNICGRKSNNTLFIDRKVPKIMNENLIKEGLGKYYTSLASIADKTRSDFLNEKFVHYLPEILTKANLRMTEEFPYSMSIKENIEKIIDRIVENSKNIQSEVKKEILSLPNKEDKINYLISWSIKPKSSNKEEYKKNDNNLEEASLNSSNELHQNRNTKIKFVNKKDSKKNIKKEQGDKKLTLEESLKHAKPSKKKGKSICEKCNGTFSTRYFYAHYKTHLLNK